MLHCLFHLFTNNSTWGINTNDRKYFYWTLLVIFINVYQTWRCHDNTGQCHLCILPRSRTLYYCCQKQKVCEKYKLFITLLFVIDAWSDLELFCLRNIGRILWGINLYLSGNQVEPHCDQVVTGDTGTMVSTGLHLGLISVTIWPRDPTLNIIIVTRNYFCYLAPSILKIPHEALKQQIALKLKHKLKALEQNSIRDALYEGMK